LKKLGVPGFLLDGNPEVLRPFLNEDHVFLTLGAGDVWKTGEKLFSSQK
jgi:hypothetical protein